MNDADTAHLEFGRRDFEEALPWYVAGTLDAAGRERVDAWLRAHPDAAAELRWHERMREATRAAALELPADLDWDEYARKMGLADAPAPAPVHAPAPGAARSRRLRDIVAAWWPTGGWRVSPALAACAAAVLVVQAGFIARLARTADVAVASYASERTETSADPVLRLRFRPDATEYQIRKLLLDADARLVDGPSQLGDYSISVAADRVEDVHRVLSGSPLVELVSAPPRLGCCTPR